MRTRADIGPRLRFVVLVDIDTATPRPRQPTTSHHLRSFVAPTSATMPYLDLTKYYEEREPLPLNYTYYPDIWSEEQTTENPGPYYQNSNRPALVTTELFLHPQPSAVRHAPPVTLGLIDPTVAVQLPRLTVPVRKSKVRIVVFPFALLCLSRFGAGMPLAGILARI